MVSTTSFLASAVVMSALFLAVVAAAELTRPGRAREPKLERRRPWVGIRLVRSPRMWFLVAVTMVVVTLVAAIGYVTGDVDSLVGMGVPGALALAALAGWLIAGRG